MKLVLLNVLRIFRLNNGFLASANYLQWYIWAYRLELWTFVGRVDLEMDKKARVRSQHCVVLGCSSSQESLNTHGAENCLLHAQKFKDCDCPPLCKLFSIPTSKDIRGRYFHVINKSDTRARTPGNVVWSPSRNSWHCVCSRHFINECWSLIIPLPSIVHELWWWRISLVK